VETANLKLGARTPRWISLVSQRFLVQLGAFPGSIDWSLLDHLDPSQSHPWLRSAYRQTNKKNKKAHTRPARQFFGRQFFGRQFFGRQVLVDSFLVHRILVDIILVDIILVDIILDDSICCKSSRLAFTRKYKDTKEV
jgi:hypothetical protein